MTYNLFYHVGHSIVAGEPKTALQKTEEPSDTICQICQQSNHTKQDILINSPGQPVSFKKSLKTKSPLA